MLNKYEQYFLEKNSKDEIDRKYYLEQLDITEKHPLYSKYFDLSAKERYIIVPSYDNKNLILIDRYIRNNFYGGIMLSNSREILEEIKEKLIKENRCYQLTLF